MMKSAVLPSSPYEHFISTYRGSLFSIAIAAIAGRGEAFVKTMMVYGLFRVMVYTSTYPGDFFGFYKQPFVCHGAK
jgi:hypothetical protein